MSIVNSIKSLAGRRIPGQLVIQYTDHCNALCPQCGMNIGNRFKRSRLTNDELKGLIDAAVEKSVEVISFTGGEPLLFFDDLIELMQYAGRAGMQYIRTGTNGFMFTGSEKPDFQDKINKMVEKLAATPVRNFWISIDSAVPELHEKMRGFPGVIAGIEKALPIFHEAGIYPSANLGINRNTGGDMNEAMGGLPPGGAGYLESFYPAFIDAFRKFYRFVIDLGFTMVNACYPMSVDAESAGENLEAVYAATSSDAVVRFSLAEKAFLFKALFNVIPEFRSKIRVFSPRSSLFSLYRQYSYQSGPAYPCRGGIDFFFVDARDGNVYPCGYRGNENMGRFQDLDLTRIKPQTPCHRCDWECFRDPSELFGPILQAMTDPLALFKRFREDGEYRRLWMEDLKYYRAAGFFNGRRPADYDRMAGFGSPVERPVKSAEPTALAININRESYSDGL